MFERFKRSGARDTNGDGYADGPAFQRGDGYAGDETATNPI